MPKHDENLNLFATEKHGKHDEVWMLQNSSSNIVCFACAVETLDDATALNVRKKKMVSDIVDLLTTNRAIWEIFNKQKATLCRTGNVLLRLLSSNDKHLSALVVDTLGVLTQRSREENTIISLLESLVSAVSERRKSSSNQEDLSPHICFLGKILRSSNSLVKILLNDHQWLLEMIVENVGKIPENQTTSYLYILAQIYRSEHAKNVSIRMSKIVLEQVVKAAGGSVSKELQLNALAVLISFAKNKVLCELIIEHDENELLPSLNAVANMIKKLMLSTHNDVQRGSIQWLTEILDNSADGDEKSQTFCQMLMTKGLCEFLFELLSSSERMLKASVLNCLHRFAACEMFFSAGHIIYGIEPILQLFKSAIATNDKFLMYPALQVLLAILQESKRCLNAIEKHLKSIFQLMKDVSDIQDSAIQNLAISCASEALRNANGNQVDLEIVSMLMQNFGKSLSKKAASESGKCSVDPVVLNLLKNTLQFVRCGMQFHRSDNATEADNDLNRYDADPNDTGEVCRSPLCLEEITYIADLYLIPATVMLLPWIRDPCIFISFFDILAVLLSNNTDKDFANKLCEASFVRIAVEVKSRLIRDNDSIERGLFVDKFLIVLICKLDDTCDGAGLKATLSAALPSLRTPPSEWHFYFSKASAKLDINMVHPIRLACISLLYISARFGSPLWRNNVTLKCITNFIADEINLESFSMALKRQLIYLWAYARSYLKDVDGDSLLAEKSIFSLIEHEREPEGLFIPDECFVHWILIYAKKAHTKLWVLSEYFALVETCDIDCEDTRIRAMIKSLSPYRNNLDFYGICIEILASGRSDIIRTALNIVSCVISDGENLENVCQIKENINRTLLSKGSEINQLNAVTLLELYRNLLLLHSSTVTDVDLKVANRLCNLFLECPFTDVHIAVLNALNQFMFHLRKSENPSHVSVICNERLIKEVATFIPHQMAFRTIQVERLSAACLVFVSQLAVTLTAQRFRAASIQQINLKKEVLIVGLAYSKSSLIQLACLQFWSSLLALGQSRALFFQNGEESLNLCEEEIQLILIYIQNLLLSNEKLIRDMSLMGISQAVHALQKLGSNFESPWNAFILEFFHENLAFDFDLEFNIKTVLFLFKNGTQLKDMTAVVSSVMHIIKSRQADIDREVTEDLLQLICILAGKGQFSASQTGEIDTFLHTLEDQTRDLITRQSKLNTISKAKFVLFSEVLFPVHNECQASMESVLECIAECKKKLSREQLSIMKRMNDVNAEEL